MELIINQCSLLFSVEMKFNLKNINFSNVFFLFEMAGMAFSGKNIVGIVENLKNAIENIRVLWHFIV
ncbi:hypothetical protein [Photorhabdus australis]|uniref:hypothetical protein n=1 Tax=Photorhabdus australis TaxID=286156 RepID=UPI00055F3CD2